MKRVECQQGTTDWMLARRAIPTASEFGRIVSPKTGQLKRKRSGEGVADGVMRFIADLIAERYDPDYGAADDYQSAAMRRGQLIEPEARAWFELEHNATVRQVGFCLSDCGRYGASPDGELIVGDSEGMEVKSPEKLGIHVQRLMDPDSFLEEFRPQVHGGLLVTGWRRWHLMSYHPEMQPLVLTIEPDKYTDALRKAVDEFCDLLAEYKARFADPDEVSDEAEAEAVESMF